LQIAGDDDTASPDHPLGSSDKAPDRGEKEESPHSVTETMTVFSKSVSRAVVNRQYISFVDDRFNRRNLFLKNSRA
jgi:hypothetical protein